MRSLLKGKVATTGIVIATVILSGVAIFTAYRLYQFRSRPLAPTAPESIPFAAEPPEPCARLSFTISTANAAPISTPTTIPAPTSSPPIVTSTPTPTSTTPSGRGGAATPTPTQSATPQVTLTATPTPTSAQIAQASPSPTTQQTTEDTLPDAGVSLPTIISLGFGTLLLFFALLIAI